MYNHAAGGNHQTDAAAHCIWINSEPGYGPGSRLHITRVHGCTADFNKRIRMLIGGERRRKGREKGIIKSVNGVACTEQPTAFIE